MPDIVDSATRSRMMSGIRGKDTKPEMIIRRGLHALGFRYRLHDGRLPGRPDLILRSRKAVIFVHGCFWHGHDCHLFRLPGTRQEFWKAKIDGNRQRDRQAEANLRSGGWRVALIWECAMRGRGRIALDRILDDLATWLRGDSPVLDIRGSA
ncbi:MAG: very short patch repair endonuclease [Pseudomonadota bacterium]